jgi:hypothetical protein
VALACSVIFIFSVSSVAGVLSKECAFGLRVKTLVLFGLGAMEEDEVPFLFLTLVFGQESSNQDKKSDHIKNSVQSPLAMSAEGSSHGFVLWLRISSQQLIIGSLNSIKPVIIRLVKLTSIVIGVS